MTVHTAKVMPILSSVLVLIGFFLTSCVGINLHTRSENLYALGGHSPPSSIVTIKLVTVQGGIAAWLMGWDGSNLGQIHQMDDSARAESVEHPNQMS